jgi:hypothetical protein
LAVIRFTAEEASSRELRMRERLYLVANGKIKTCVRWADEICSGSGIKWSAVYYQLQKIRHRKFIAFGIEFEPISEFEAISNGNTLIFND